VVVRLVMRVIMAVRVIVGGVVVRLSHIATPN
jgi:hypothetical protein